MRAAKKKTETKASLKKELRYVRRALAQLEQDIDRAGQPDVVRDDAHYIERLEKDAAIARERLNAASETFRMLAKALNARMIEHGPDAKMTDGEMRDLFLRAAGEVAHAAYELDSDDERMRKLRWFFARRAAATKETTDE